MYHPVHYLGLHSTRTMDSSDIPSSQRFSDSQRVLAICATSLGSADRVYSCPTPIYRPDYYFGLHSTRTMGSFVIPSSRRFSDSQRVLAICAASMGSSDRVLVPDSHTSPGLLFWTSLYWHNGLPLTSPVPGDSATLRGCLQYALPLWDR